MSPEKICNKIIEIACENFIYFRKNPKHLAWVMMHYELIHNACRLYLNACNDNPKYAVLEAPLKSQKDLDLLYESWCVSFADEGEYFKDYNENYVKFNLNNNKTLEDWENYYNYNNKEKLYEILRFQLNFKFGDLKWNENGCLELKNPFSFKEKYIGYSKCEKEIPEKIRNAILKLKNNKKIKKHIDEYEKIIKINNPALKIFENKKNYILDAQGLNINNKNKKEILKQYKFLCYCHILLKEVINYTDKDFNKIKNNKKHKNVFLENINLNLPISLSYSIPDYEFKSMIVDCLENNEFNIDKLYQFKYQSRCSFKNMYKTLDIKIKNSLEKPENQTGIDALKWICKLEMLKDKYNLNKTKIELPNNVHKSYLRLITK